VSKQTYHPQRGDIIHVNFAPSAGREFTGPHYALVISTAAFAKATGLCIALPATSKFHGDQRLAGTGLMVQLPSISGLSKEGWLYTHMIKTLDYRERGASFIAKVDDDFLLELMDRTRTFIDPDTPG
jgi:mRNA-degrading endonuclease toxin of MazEF toxin-antitoxin module